LINRYKTFLNRSLWQIFHPFKKDSNTSYAEYDRPDTCSIISDGYQMIYNLKSHSFQLFNLKADPLAKENIAKDRNSISERLFSKFKEVYSAAPIYKASIINLDEETREQLEALGYLDSQEHAYEDSDMDGIPNKSDNCLHFPNPKQQDRDGDKIGDMCDECTDTDGDNYGDPGFPKDNCAVDNCPNEPNPSQEDADRDGRGNECDNCFETPNGPIIGTCLGGLNDGWRCSDDEYCGLDGFCSMDQEDSDGDGIGDACDPNNASTTTTADSTTTTTACICPLLCIFGEISDEVELLRFYRDNVLSQTPEGQELITLYYQWSPVITEAMEEDEEFKKEVKNMIDAVLELIMEEEESLF
jgi:hypothetical protein